VLRSGWVFPPPVFWIFMEQGKIMEAEVPTVRVGAIPTGLTAPPLPQPPRLPFLPPNQQRHSTESIHVTASSITIRNSVHLMHFPKPSYKMYKKSQIGIKIEIETDKPRYGNISCNSPHVMR